MLKENIGSVSVLILDIAFSLSAVSQYTRLKQLLQQDEKDEVIT